MKTEYLGSGEPDDEALQLLLMRRKIAGFDAEESVAAVAEHIFVLRIPSHRVRVRLLIGEGRKKEREDMVFILPRSTLCIQA